MKISNIQIEYIEPRGGLIGFASLVLNDNLQLTGIGIHKKLNSKSYRLTYPTIKVKNQDRYYFNPIDSGLSRLIEESIFEKLPIGENSKNICNTKSVNRLAQQALSKLSNKKLK